MSTHCRIWLKLNKESLGTVATCDLNKLPNPLVENNYPCLPVKLPKDPDAFLGIYCHFDGYPSGAGKELKNKFNTYEKVLNLILLGDVSYIIDEIKSYHNWRNEPVNIQISHQCPKASEDFTYIFRDNKWHDIENYLNIFEDE